MERRFCKTIQNIYHYYTRSNMFVDNFWISSILYSWNERKVKYNDPLSHLQWRIDIFTYDWKWKKKLTKNNKLDVTSYIIGSFSIRWRRSTFFFSCLIIIEQKGNITSMTCSEVFPTKFMCWLQIFSTIQ